ncbi:MAG: questin oxidase family protein [Usitatibacter sp.]
MSIAAGTRARIEGAHRFSAFYRGHLASHYPMAIVALDSMGADAADMDRFEARYLPLLEPMAEGAAAVEAFAAAIARDGEEAVLRHWIPRLTHAVASGAFHGAIRTAFALESGSSRELAHALAYWQAAYEALRDAPPFAGSLAPHDVLRTIARDSRFAGHKPPGRNIIERTVAASQMPGFDSHVGAIDPTKADLDSIARAVLRAYAACGDFTLLHCVTGCHALRLLSPYAGAGATRRLWPAIVAAYIGAGAPPLEGWGLVGDDSLDWEAIKARAIRCEDEHDIKFAYSCWREWQHRGDDLYRRVASARVCSAGTVAPAPVMAAEAC